MERQVGADADDMSLPSTTVFLKANIVSAKIGPVLKPPERELSLAAATVMEAVEILSLLLIVLFSREKKLTS